MITTATITTTVTITTTITITVLITVMTVSGGITRTNNIIFGEKDAPCTHFN